MTKENAMKNLMLSCLTGLCCLLSFAAAANPPAEPTYSFSVAPQFERRKLFSIWQPIVDDLQRRAGLRFELVTALSVDDYEGNVKNGRCDFIYVNPSAGSVMKSPGALLA